MNKLERLMQQAVAAHRSGDLNTAASAYRKVLDGSPGHPEALHLLGLVAYQGGQFAAALDHVRRAIERNPGQALYHFNLGRILRDAGQGEAAIVAYREALRLRPDYPEAADNLAAVLQAAGQIEAALACLDAIVCRRPNDAGAWVRLAGALADAARFDAATQCFERALALLPNEPEIFYRYGGMLLRAGQPERAQAALERAVALNPALAEAHNRLAAAHLARQRMVAAEASLRQALRLKPEFPEAWLNLGNLLAERGAPAAEVLDCLRRAGPLCRPDALRIIEALLIPPLLDDLDAADALRADLDRQLDRLLAAELRIDDPLRELGRTGLFSLAYHGRSDRAIYEKTAALLRRACPSLAYVAPHCRPGVAHADAGQARRWRVGFVSAYFCDHTIGNLFKDLIADFDRQRFAIVALFAPGIQDAVSRQIAGSCEQAIVLTADLAAARATIAELELDVLVYPDVGMDPFTAFLGHARLAPLQCATWGHPATTGLPTIDVFLSSRHQERDGAQADYSETLVCLDHPLYVYARPPALSAPVDRAEFGFGDGTLYICPQSLFKIQPQFDTLIAGILRRDPGGRLALPEGKFPQWSEALRQRFRRVCPDVADRIVFMPRLAHDRYRRFLAVADVMLDSLPFGGGLTTLDALALGTPIVTLPGPLMSSRFTSTCYERMGLRDCIATSAEDYVAKAVAIATSPAERQRLGHEIRQRNGVLYGNRAVVRELEDFFATGLAKPMS